MKEVMVVAGCAGARYAGEGDGRVSAVKDEMPMFLGTAAMGK